MPADPVALAPTNQPATGLALAPGSPVCVSCEKRRATWRTYDGDYCHDCMQAHHLEKMLVQLGRLNHR